MEPLLKNTKFEISNIASSIFSRTMRNVTVNTASIPAETVPLVGTGLVVAVTAMDVHDACQSMKEVNTILEKLKLKKQSKDEKTICSKNIPRFKHTYQRMQNDLGGFIAYLKTTSEDEVNNFMHTTGGTVDQAAKNISNDMDSAYTTLGGVLCHASDMLKISECPD